MSGYIGVDPVPNVNTVVIQGTFSAASTTLSVPTGYFVGNIEVFLNGLRIKETDFTAVDGYNVIFKQTVQAGTDYLIQDVRNYTESQSSGRLNKVETQNRATVKRLASEAGFNLVDGSFEEGGVLNSDVDVLWCQTDGKYYNGVIGTIATGSTPDIGWTDRSMIRRNIRYGLSVPTSGTYSVGDIQWNLSPTPSSYIGWCCTASGSPGTWKPFGLISV